MQYSKPTNTPSNFNFNFQSGISHDSCIQAVLDFNSNTVVSIMYLAKKKKLFE